MWINQRLQMTWGSALYKKLLDYEMSLISVLSRMIVIPIPIHQLHYLSRHLRHLRHWPKTMCASLLRTQNPHLAALVQSPHHYWSPVLSFLFRWIRRWLTPGWIQEFFLKAGKRLWLYLCWRYHVRLDSVFKNFFPLSNLACISKLTERPVFNQTYGHIVRSLVFIRCCNLHIVDTTE